MLSLPLVVFPPLLFPFPPLSLFYALGAPVSRPNACVCAKPASLTGPGIGARERRWLTELHLVGSFIARAHRAALGRRLLELSPPFPFIWTPGNLPFRNETLWGVFNLFIFFCPSRPSFFPAFQCFSVPLHSSLESRHRIQLMSLFIPTAWPS